MIGAEVFEDDFSILVARFQQPSEPLLRQAFARQVDELVRVFTMIARFASDESVGEEDELARDIDKPIEDRTPGGLGIHLVKSMVDGLSYQYDARVMRIIATKDLWT